MKFSCEKELLNDAISHCLHAVAAKSSIPVLEGILIQADEQGYYGADITLKQE